MARISEAQLRAIIRSELIKEMLQNNVDESKKGSKGRNAMAAAIGAGALALGAADVADTAYGISHSYSTPESDLSDEYVSVYNDMNYMQKAALVNQINDKIVSFGFDMGMQTAPIMTDRINNLVIDLIRKHPNKFRIVRLGSGGFGPTLAVNWNTF